MVDASTVAAQSAAADARNPNPPGFDLRTEVYKSLISRGLNSQQAMGVLYSLMGESGTALDPNSHGDGGKSYGFGQWNGTRFAALENTAKGMGTTWNDPRAQLAHFNNEIDGLYKGELDRVKANATTAADATRLWTGSVAEGIGYERPATNNWQGRYVQGSQAGRLDPKTNEPVWTTGPAAPLPTGAPTQGPNQPGAAPAPPATSGAQDFAEAAKKGDVGGALASLTKGDETKGGGLGSLGDQIAKAAPVPQSSAMLSSAAQDTQGSQAQAGQALLGQVLEQSAKPLTWSSRPYGAGVAGPQIPGTTLNSMGI
jgi:hypothetical protein